MSRFKRISQIPNVEILFSSKSVTDSGGEDLLEERLVSPVGSPSLIFETVNASGSIANLGSIDETNFIEENSASPIRSFSGSDNFENELDIHESAGFSEELKALGQEANDKLGSSDDCPQASQERSNDGCYASGENADGLEKRPAKKRGSRDGEEGKGKRKKKAKSTDGDARYEASERTKLKLAKERKSYLDMIHVKSQRLLRETRDASCNPAPIVQKPISSVPEKIRKRKLEVLKKS
ncbi:rRNA biogenesis protein RRP36-like [Aristolochia californica]|uniref:rRNA biogenesis protein RRP36-like n=1 Tax=Aristolochia californica TaxID=171875 RepID=UPI0035D7D64E